MIKNFAKYLFIVSLAITLSNTQSDVYSSITTLQDAFNTEKIMFDNLEKFIKESEVKIYALKRFINSHEPVFFNSNITSSEVISENPLSKLVSLRKFLKKSDVIEFLLSQTPETDVSNFTRFKFINTYPTDEDLEGIVRGIARLQEVYDLGPRDLLNDENLSASDLFQIGYRLRQINEDKFATKWFAESLKQLELEETEFRASINKKKILYYLATSKWKEGGYNNTIQAVNILKDILQINPEDKVYKDRIESFKTPCEKDEDIALNGHEKQKQLYNLACRGELQKSAKETRELRCRYLIKNHPFLKLARVKYEELNKEPLALLFHDVITDNEIELLKLLVRRKLKTSRIWDFDAGEEKQSEVRTGKNAWLDTHDNDLVSVIRRRVEHLTNFVAKLNSFEQVQLGNYGIGGHYFIHADYFIENPDENVEKYAFYETGNRIATLMFYLSDVEKGGSTVFPYMKLNVKPQKGTALFWHNLYASGAIDNRTMHAACPVIIGSKWVANHWIREKEQTFKRPCKLYDDSNI